MKRTTRFYLCNASAQLHFFICRSAVKLKRLTSCAQLTLRHVMYTSSVLIAIPILFSTGTQAQTYPSKSVTIYVGFPAGSTNDSTARAMAQQLSEQLGQQFVVVNRDGAAGVIAATAVSKMKPDGYSLLWAGSGMLASTPVFNTGITYDSLKDFSPVSVYCYIPYVMVVHPSVPAKSLPELIQLAKAQPGKLSFGSSGVGGVLHLATELMLSMSDTKMLHIPYRGTPGMTLDLISGQIDLVTTSPSMAAPHIQSGRMRAIGVTSSKRSNQLPEVKTIAEAGLPGYELTGWFSIVAPGSTPTDIIVTLFKQMAKALEQPSVKANITTEGAIPGGNTPEQFSVLIRSEITKYTQLRGKIQLNN
jgi:tripartite-type tricarboxylate transporter receptor subunit TctC